MWGLFTRRKFTKKNNFDVHVIEGHFSTGIPYDCDSRLNENRDSKP